MTSSFAFAARIAAEKIGVRTATLLLAPVAFFSSEDPPHFFELPWLPRLRRLFGVRATRAVLDLGRRRSRRLTHKISDFRRRVGAPALAGDEVMDGPLRADIMFALYSPQLGPLPADAPPQSRIAGFTFYCTNLRERYDDLRWLTGQLVVRPKLRFDRGLTREDTELLAKCQVTLRRNGSNGFS